MLSGGWSFIKDFSKAGENTLDKAAKGNAEDAGVGLGGFVINAGGATARDVRTLMDNVRDIVYKKYGVTLEPEVKFLGDFEA